MKTINLTAKINVCAYDELTNEEKLLIERAKEAATTAYAPYSNFRVGAAVWLMNGEIVAGSNQENASFPAGICAERTALSYANARYPDSAVAIIAIAAMSGDRFTDQPISPCGICRQTILEAERRFNQPVRILLYGAKEVLSIDSIEDLLPLSFHL